jgi:hypothetical protein
MSSGEEYVPESEDESPEEDLAGTGGDEGSSSEGDQGSVKSSSDDATSVGGRDVQQWRETVAASLPETEPVHPSAKATYEGATQRSGYRIKLPKEFDLNVVRTEQGHLRHLKDSTKRRIKRNRQKRRQIRQLLKDGNKEEANHFTLQSSSSEGDSDDERVDLPPGIPWNEVKRGKKRPLLHKLAQSDVTSLIGWATHLSSDTPCQQHVLMDLPNTPLQPSLINYIKDQTVATQRQPTNISWEAQIFDARGDDLNLLPSAIPPIPMGRSKRVKKPFWKYHDIDVTYRWLKDNWTPTETVEFTAPVVPRKRKAVVESLELDVPGEVALGMMIEEAMTAILMPLARRHAASCRTKTGAFDEWTLPPEEAIVMSSSGVDVSKKGTETLDSTFIAQWAESRGLDPLFVEANLDVYMKLLRKDGKL